MRVTLISVYESLTAYGLRLLSAVLKSAGLDTRQVFLPRETENLPWDGFRYPYPAAVLDQLAELAAGSGLIGISLSTNYFQNAAQITQRLRRSTGAPIVWGGIHPTVRPEECLEHADLVCVGEGEEALLELAQRLAQGEDHRGIANMWYRQDGAVVRTPLRPLVQDLDRYPYPDYDPETSFVLHQGVIQKLTPELVLYYARWPHAHDSVPIYETILSRGCSYHCTYCCNNALRAIYKDEWRVRRRSVGHLIGELQQITARFPGFQLISINDDEFLSDLEAVREFSAAYRLALDIPFMVVGFQPPRVSAEMIGLLVDAGMQALHMGIQTGSMRTMHQIYRRPVRREQILQATQVLSKFAGRLSPPYYDVITDNPWETEQDRLETLAMLLDVPKPYRLQIFALTLFPGTELHRRAVREGLLDDEIGQVYHKHYLQDRTHSYFNAMLRLFQLQRAPRWLLALLLHERFRRRPWLWLPPALVGFFRAIQLAEFGARALWRGDWASIARYFRRVHLRRLPQPYADQGGWSADSRRQM